MLQSLFKLQQHQSTLKTECFAGLSSFATASYLLLVAPLILTHAGIGFAFAYLITCGILAIGCLLMAFIANFPAMLGPGLGLLTYFSYVVIGQTPLSLSQAFAAIFCAGVLMTLFTISKLRQRFLKAIPSSLGSAIAGGIGFFIAFVALKNAQLVVGNPNTLVQFTTIITITKALFFIGFFITAYLSHRGFKLAILLGILITTAIYYLLGLQPQAELIQPPSHLAFHGFQLDFSSINLHWISVTFTFFIIALFDSTGTLLGLSHQISEKNTVIYTPRLQKALVAESVSAMIAPLIGITTPCPLVESATGIASGGRTGLTSLTASLLFLAVIPLMHFAAYIPTCATSAALFYTACLMLKPIAKIHWDNPKDYIPAVITLMIIPMSFSITNGVGLGIICYVVLNCFGPHWRKIDPLMWLFSTLFLFYFLY